MIDFKVHFTFTRVLFSNFHQFNKVLKSISQHRVLNKTTLVKKAGDYMKFGVLQPLLVSVKLNDLVGYEDKWLNVNLSALTL